MRHFVSQMFDRLATFAIKPTLSFFSRVGEGQTKPREKPRQKWVGVQLQQGRYFSAWRSRE